MWNLQASLFVMVTIITFVRGQRSDSGKCARIVTLRVHFLICLQVNVSCLLLVL
jgi:hypothetical protein